MKFAEILVNHPISSLKGNLTYEVPETFEIQEGQLVSIPFRTLKKTGIVIKIHEKKPSYPTKKIIEILSECPILLPWQQKLLEWIQNDSLCDLYRAYKLFIPEKIFSGIIPLHLTLLSNPLSEKKTPKTWIYQHELEEERFEQYKKMIEKTIQKEQQAVLLVSELCMVKNILPIFQDKNFQDKKCVLWHGSLTEKTKAEIWMDVRMNKTSLIIGSRSSLFLPYQNLGLIIVDQEHDNISYRQEQSPKYHTRNVVKKIQECAKNSVVLASHAPSIESYYLTQTGNARLVQSKKKKKRNIIMVDMSDELKRKNYSLISECLEREITKNLHEKKQTILFINKKGSISAILCRECGEKVECPNCHTALPYFRTKKLLICNTCGLKKDLPVRCKKCNSTYLKPLGGGTEKVEETVHNLFPKSNIIRIDSDTVKTIKDFKKAIPKIQEADIIVGTQLLLKLETYPRAGCIGIILADLQLSRPDYQASEESFQTFSQLILTNMPGDTVIIQTYQPSNIFFTKLKQNNYPLFFKEEINKRNEFQYPPFTRLLRLTCQHENSKRVQYMTNIMLQTLKKIAEKKELSKIYEIPAIPSFHHGKYQHHIIIKSEHPQKLLKNIPLGKEWKIDPDPINLT
ncbi:primosomal protein N' [Candidatus Peregrinibacteria bacterium]|nr:primosomal protein N' [Candidatus Peregrinibacteria bacterium]